MKKLGMLGIAVLALVTLSAYTMAVRGQDQRADEYVIVPGHRIGSFTLDRTLKSYIQEFGPDHTVSKDAPMAGTNSYFWRWQGITIYARGDTVIQVGLTTRALGRLYAEGDPRMIALQRRLERYRTPEGLALGQPSDRVRALYGAPDYVKDFPETDRFRWAALVYAHKGFYVVVESKATPGTVFEIGVFRPNTPNWW